MLPCWSWKCLGDYTYVFGILFYAVSHVTFWVCVLVISVMNSLLPPAEMIVCMMSELFFDAVCRVISTVCTQILCVWTHFCMFFISWPSLFMLKSVLCILCVFSVDCGELGCQFKCSNQLYRNTHLCSRLLCITWDVKLWSLIYHVISPV